MRIEIFDCFCTSERNSGNAAGVILDFEGDDVAKQELAKRLKLPVIVFLTNKDPIFARFFYPDAEMPMCVHGSLAAAHFLMKNKHQTSLTLDTLKQKQLKFIANRDVVNIQLQAMDFPDAKINKEIVLNMLGLNNANEISSSLPLRISSVGSPKLLIPLHSQESLSALNPDFSLIKNWSIENKINGIYVYAQQTDSIFRARAFNPQTGHHEDAATGVAAGALALALEKSIIVEQGTSMNKPCQINVTYKHAQEIYVGGLIRPH